MKHLPMIFCLILVVLLGFRYYEPNAPISAKVWIGDASLSYQSPKPLLKPEKLVLLRKPVPQVDSSYDTAYARYLRHHRFKYVLKGKNWTKSIENNIAAQDRLILFYHKEITKRRRLLNRQLDEIAKLNHQ